MMDMYEKETSASRAQLGVTGIVILTPNASPAQKDLIHLSLEALMDVVSVEQMESKCKNPIHNLLLLGPFIFLKY